MSTFNNGFRFVKVDSGHLQYNSGTFTDQVLYTIPSGYSHAICFLKYYGGHNSDGGSGPSFNVSLSRPNFGYSGSQKYALRDTYTPTVTPLTVYPQLDINLTSLSYSTDGSGNHCRVGMPGDSIVWTKFSASGAGDIVWFNYVVFLIPSAGS